MGTFCINRILPFTNPIIKTGYVETPLQTLDGIIVNQPKRFFPLVEEAKCLAE